MQKIINLFSRFPPELLVDLRAIKQNRPLIHNITNLVVMNTCANLLLSINASPLMAHAEEELADIVNLAEVLVINIGTVDNSWINSIFVAQKIAREKKIPVIFDPVGAGASRYRTDLAKQILYNGVSVIKGNAAEIMSLSAAKVRSSGVDSLYNSQDANPAAQWLANTFNCIVAVSGPQDLIIDRQQEFVVQHGTPMFRAVTGMGCSLTALIGAFVAVNQDLFLATKHALLLFNLVGEFTAEETQGSGSFYIKLLDNLYSLQCNL